VVDYCCCLALPLSLKSVIRGFVLLRLMGIRDVVVLLLLQFYDVVLLLAVNNALMLLLVRFCCYCFRVTSVDV
jgi:hypothetical protein